MHRSTLFPTKIRRLLRKVSTVDGLDDAHNHDLGPTVTSKKTATKATKKAPAKRAPAKKAVAKKAAAKKAVAKKAVAKKTPVRKAAVKKAVAKKVSGPKADRVIKTTSTKKAASKKAPSKRKAAVATATPVRRKPKVVTAPKNAGVKPAYLKDKQWLKARQAALEEERAELREQVEEFAAQLDELLETAEAGDDNSSDESSEGTSINVQISELVIERKGRLEHIEMIDEALARIEAGAYGFCDVDNVAIPKARLEARPESERCVEHKTSMFDNSRR
ncbi:MAG: hypothetical protein HKN03_10230 [Acidimicrobiales bacterium]|nr:hypothetical protein [Acidimicrobiales bacterium]